jgi:hypothetical protein
MVIFFPEVVEAMARLQSFLCGRLRGGDGAFQGEGGW